MIFKLAIITTVSMYITSLNYALAQLEKKDVCDCEFVYAPVCGSHGVTFPNQCGLDCHKANEPGVQKIHDGECEEDAERVPNFPGCICTKRTKMVCASNGWTYPSRCSLECAREADSSITFQFMGPCSYRNATVN